jgi:type IV secretory pathway VirB10-like protein
MPENPGTVSNTPNTLEDKALKPKGVIPKNAQSLVIISVAVLMILIMWLTGGKKATVVPTPATAPTPPVTPIDPSKVEAFKQAIQAEQQNVMHSYQGQPGTSSAGAGNHLSANSYASLPGQAAAYPAGSLNSGVAVPPGAPQGQSAGEQPDPIKAEEKRRKYESLFASNVALTYRHGEVAHKLTAMPDSRGSASESPDAQAQATRDAEALAAMGPPPWMTPPQLGSQPSSQPVRDQASAKVDRSQAKLVNPGVPQPGQFDSSSGKKYVLFEGTIIPAVLTNRLNGSFSGPVNCLVTENVYSHDRQHVLIPPGSKVLGEARHVNAFGQQRLAVFFHRLIMPDGYSVSLDQFKGLDQQGATALHDKVNNHYAKIFGASLAVGLLGGISGLGTAPVLSQSYLDQMRVGFGESMAMSGEQIMNRFLNLMPTITIREGNRVEIYLSNDLLLPDYTEHTMPSDM